MYHFCTYFDRNYCEKGLALYESLKKHVNSFRLYILCLDDETYEIFNRLNLKYITLVKLQDLEYRDPEFYATKKTRTLIEYYFTCTPVFTLDILNQHPDISVITYLDADLFFLGSIEPVFEEMGKSSILIIEHRFSESLKSLVVCGRFNVGYLSFRSDNQGITCLQLWRKQCIEWCYDYIDGDRFADQKYLDKWPELFPNLKILKNIGVNVGPWNALNYFFSKDALGQYKIDDEVLRVFHFHLFKEIFRIHNFLCFSMGYNESCALNNKKVLKQIYKDYLICLLKCRNIVTYIPNNCIYIDNSIRDLQRIKYNNNQNLYMSLLKFKTKIIDIFKLFLYNNLIFFLDIKNK